MALIAIAADKGAPGVTTTAVALAAVWPRPVLLAECDPAGGDLVYRFLAAGGGHLDPRRGVLSLAIAGRRGMPAQQAWEHVQKMQGGMDLLAGVTNAEQGAGLNTLWGSIGRLLAGLPQADVIADCGRLGVDGPVYDLLAEAALVLLVSRAAIADVIRLRDRAAALATAAGNRRRGVRVGVLVVADQKRVSSALGEVQYVLDQGSVPATVIGGLPDDPRSALLFRDGQVGKLNKSVLIRSARTIAKQIVNGLPGQPQAEQPQPPLQPPQAQPQAQASAQASAQAAPAQAQPQQAPAQQQAPGVNPPGVLVASRRGRHNRGQHTEPHQLQPGQPPANVFPSPGPLSAQLPPLPDPAAAQQAGQPHPGQPHPGQPHPGQPVPAREQSGRG